MIKLLMGLILFGGPLFASRLEAGKPHTGSGRSSARLSQENRRKQEREKVTTYFLPEGDSDRFLTELDELLQSIYLINSGRKPTVPTN